MLCQSYVLHSRHILTLLFGVNLGFLPVLYTWLNTRRTPPPVFLPSDSDHDVQLQAKSAPPSQQLRGFKLLLLWFPAICDLTGTTVREFPIHILLPNLPSASIPSYQTCSSLTP